MFMFIVNANAKQRLSLTRCFIVAQKWADETKWLENIYCLMFVHSNDDDDDDLSTRFHSHSLVAW